MTDNHDKRIENLESALAHQELQVQELSDIATAQWKEIERLKRYIAKTEDKLDDYIDSAKDNEGLSATEIAARDKPPHY